jgi:Uma2 family endonuclease
VVIEIVSPDETIDKTRERFLDYQHLGVPHILLMHPEAYVAYRFDNGSVIQQRFEFLALPTGSVAFDSEELFRQLRSELEHRRESAKPEGV